MSMMSYVQSGKKTFVSNAHWAPISTMKEYVSSMIPPANNRIKLQENVKVVMLDMNFLWIKFV